MKIGCKILLITILILIEADTSFLEGKSSESKVILILFGLSPVQPAYQPILGGIREKLTEEFGDKYDIHTEYFEIESYPLNNYPSDRFKLYNEKYRKIKLDLLICVGRGALDVIKKNAEEYLLSLQTISIDFDFSNYGLVSDLRLNKNTAVVGIKFNIDKMISTALTIFPQTTSIYFIGGTTTFDKYLMSIAFQASEKIDKEKRIEFVSDITMDSILHKVNILPKGSIIFVPSFNTDSKKVTYFNPEAIRLISLSANSPVFAYSDMGFGEGSVGGYLLSFEKVGLYAGETAVKILNGSDPESFVATESDYYDFLFDWRELKRWNIHKSILLPEDSKILFEEVNLLEEFKWIFGAVLLFLVLQSILIANLIRLNRNQKLMTNKIIETENKYREFLHMDRSLRLGQLTASLSHELNQPLTAILSTAQAGINFINSNESTPDLMKQILLKIVDNDKRGASILSSIRGMMKLENREKEKVNLNKLIDEVLVVIQSEANKRNTQLNEDLTSETVYILADGIQIQQVLLNFILNALQSMDRINATNKEIIISSFVKDTEVIVSVRDRGPGIDEEMKDKIFKPFITSKKEGTGIGLSICQSIIEDHQGKIWVENMPDGGANFSFCLKIFKDEKI